jgi:lysophospholipase L1-like esterase
VREDAVAATNPLRVAAFLSMFAIGGCSRSTAPSAPPAQTASTSSAGIASGEARVTDGAPDTLDAGAALPSQGQLRVRVLPLGDSITDGEKLPGAWRPEMKRACVGITLDLVGSMSNGPSGFEDREHEGHIGWTIDRVAARAQEWTHLAEPDVVLLMLGTNDIAIGSRLESAPQRLANLVRVIHAAAPRARLLVSTLPPMTRVHDWLARVDRFNQALPGVVVALRRDGVPAVLVHVGDALTPDDLRDGVHPSAAGNAQLGRAWCDALQAVVGVSRQ